MVWGAYRDLILDGYLRLNVDRHQTGEKTGFVPEYFLGFNFSASHNEKYQAMKVSISRTRMENWSLG